MLSLICMQKSLQMFLHIKNCNHSELIQCQPDWFYVCISNLKWKCCLDRKIVQVNWTGILFIWGIDDFAIKINKDKNKNKNKIAKYTKQEILINNGQANFEAMIKQA
eukprot:231952_1